MTSHVASAPSASSSSPSSSAALHFRPQFSLPSVHHNLRPSSMAALMQSNNEPIAISNPPDFLKQSAKPDSTLSSIASAGLNVSRARDLPSSTTTMASPAAATATTTTTTSAPPAPTTTTTATTTAGTPSTTTPAPAPAPTPAAPGSIEMDRRSSDPQDRVAAEAHHHSSQAVAREALGASEKSHPSDNSIDQMQVDSQPHPGNNHHHPHHPHAHPHPQQQQQQPDHSYGPSPSDTNNGSAAAAAAAATATSLLNAPTTVASPGPMDESTSQDGDRPRHRDEAELADEASNKAFSYPMPALGFGDARRGLSLPGSGFGRSAGQRSPGAKKHQCPYCATEFTRHHNLKSHLLTHSQEKPYVCQTCQSRFRRLHDLKRHTKLHTGERPHICPKCGRRFARGDALARHNKGQGGCAGRRSSMGSYVADDDYGDGHAHAEDTMDGLVYAEPEPMHEEDERRLSNAPGIRKHDTSSGDSSLSRSSTFHSRQPSTYPPIAAGRPSPGSGGLFPPLAGHGAPSTSASPISQNGSHMTFPPAGQPSGASVFHPSSSANNNNNGNNGSTLIESPKPLSPNALSQPGPDHRTHSPPQQQQQQQQQQPFSRPPQTGLGLPPPQPGVPQLPPPPGMNSTDSRFAALHTPGTVQPPPTAARHTPSHSHSSNHSGGPLAKTGPDATTHSNNYPPYDPNLLEPGSRDDKLWSYIKSVHEELISLRTEVSTLRNQLASNVTGPSLLEGQR